MGREVYSLLVRDAEWAQGSRCFLPELVGGKEVEGACANRNCNHLPDPRHSLCVIISHHQEAL